MNYQHQITRVAELRALSDFCNFVQETCKQHPGISDQVVYDLQLAVDEACANIITHGYAGVSPGPITLSLELSSQQVVATITDLGHPFEPKEPPEPDIRARLEDRQVGGLGLYFIYKKVDQVLYETTADSNRLTLIKRV